MTTCLSCLSSVTPAPTCSACGLPLVADLPPAVEAEVATRAYLLAALARWVAGARIAPELGAELGESDRLAVDAIARRYRREPAPVAEPVPEPSSTPAPMGSSVVAPDPVMIVTESPRPQPKRLRRPSWWAAIARPFLAQSWLYMIGTFLVLASAFYLVSLLWSGMGSLGRYVLLWSVVTALAMGFSAVGRWLLSRFELETASRVFGLVAFGLVGANALTSGMSASESWPVAALLTVGTVGVGAGSLWALSAFAHHRADPVHAQVFSAVGLILIAVVAATGNTLGVIIPSAALALGAAWLHVRLAKGRGTGARQGWDWATWSGPVVYTVALVVVLVIFRAAQQGSAGLAYLGVLAALVAALLDDLDGELTDRGPRLTWPLGLSASVAIVGVALAAAEALPLALSATLVSLMAIRTHLRTGRQAFALVLSLTGPLVLLGAQGAISPVVWEAGLWVDTPAAGAPLAVAALLLFVTAFVIRRWAGRSVAYTNAGLLAASLGLVHLAMSWSVGGSELAAFGAGYAALLLVTALLLDRRRLIAAAVVAGTLCMLGAATLVSSGPAASLGAVAATALLVWVVARALAAAGRRRLAETVDDGAVLLGVVATLLALSGLGGEPWSTPDASRVVASVLMLGVGVVTMMQARRLVLRFFAYYGLALFGGSASVAGLVLVRWLHIEPPPWRTAALVMGLGWLALEAAARFKGGAAAEGNRGRLFGNRPPVGQLQTLWNGPLRVASYALAIAGLGLSVRSGVSELFVFVAGLSTLGFTLRAARLSGSRRFGVLAVIAYVFTWFAFGELLPPSRGLGWLVFAVSGVALLSIVTWGVKSWTDAKGWTAAFASIVGPAAVASWILAGAATVTTAGLALDGLGSDSVGRQGALAALFVSVAWVAAAALTRVRGFVVLGLLALAGATYLAVFGTPLFPSASAGLVPVLVVVTLASVVSTYAFEVGRGGGGQSWWRAADASELWGTAAAVSPALVLPAMPVLVVAWLLGDVTTAHAVVGLALGALVVGHRAVRELDDSVASAIGWCVALFVGGAALAVGIVGQTSQVGWHDLWAQWGLSLALVAPLYLLVAELGVRRAKPFLVRSGHVFATVVSSAAGLTALVALVSGSANAPLLASAHAPSAMLAAIVSLLVIHWRRADLTSAAAIAVLVVGWGLSAGLRSGVTSELAVVLGIGLAASLLAAAARWAAGWSQGPSPRLQTVRVVAQWSADVLWVGSLVLLGVLAAMTQLHLSIPLLRPGIALVLAPVPLAFDAALTRRSTSLVMLAMVLVLAPLVGTADPDLLSAWWAAGSLLLALAALAATRGRGAAFGALILGWLAVAALPAGGVLIPIAVALSWLALSLRHRTDLWRVHAAAGIALAVHAAVVALVVTPVAHPVLTLTPSLALVLVVAAVGLTHLLGRRDPGWIRVADVLALSALALLGVELLGGITAHPIAQWGFGLTLAASAWYWTFRGVSTQRSRLTLVGVLSFFGIYFFVRFGLDWGHGGIDGWVLPGIGLAMVTFRTMWRRLGGDRLDQMVFWVALVLGPAGLALGALGDGGMPEGAFLMASALLSLIAWRFGNRALYVLAAALLHVEVFRVWLELGIDDPLWYAFPLGGTITAFTLLFRKDLSPRASLVLHTAAGLLVYLTATLQLLSFDGIGDVLTLAAVSLAGIAFGIGFKVRAPLLLGTVFLVVDVVVNLFRIGLHDRVIGMVFLFVVGVIVLATAVLLSAKRRELLASVEGLRTELDAWG